MVQFHQCFQCMESTPNYVKFVYLLQLSFVAKHKDHIRYQNTKEECNSRNSNLAKVQSFKSFVNFVSTARVPTNIYIEPITEERANRCLGRIDLLCKIREQILHHPLLDERLKLCQPSNEMPEWWICGLHDKDLLIGAAKYCLFGITLLLFSVTFLFNHLLVWVNYCYMGLIEQFIHTSCHL